MIKRISIEEFVTLALKIPVLDVRSPGEYENGHVPGANLFSLFDDHERAEIGTIFKHGGQLEAMKRGMELVGPKMGKMFAEGVEKAKNGKIMVHCWRGGKRSEAVAELLSVAGLEVYVLKGGYKRFRNWVLDTFKKEWRPLVVGGPTGSGKTEVLKALSRLGEQTLDLEELADHKGSSFGRLGNVREVTLMQFENDIAWGLQSFTDLEFWLEDESRNLGKLQMPSELWKKKINAPMYVIDLPRSVRKERLMRDYGSFPLQDLEESILRIQRRLGGLRTKQTVQALHAGDSEHVLDQLLEYYDSAYLHATQSHHSGRIIKFSSTQFHPEEIAAWFLVAKRQQQA
jgi:tRNA 2-selenouridine synthase